MTEPGRRRELLQIARRSIARRLAGEAPPEVRERPHADDPERGVFVTLKIEEELRGCIGTLSAEEGVPKTVSDFALQAGFHDPRFPPLEPEELPMIRIEISLLSPPRLVRPEDVVVGRDGLILEMGNRRGLLLPQVAREANFGREEFLAALCHKAGLPAGAWTDPRVKLYAFEAEVFGEGEIEGVR